VTRLIGANTLCSVKGLDQRMPYALDLMNAPIADLRAGFGEGLGAWAAAHPEQADLVALLMAEVNGRIPEAELRNRLNATKTAPDLPAVALPKADIYTIEATTIRLSRRRCAPRCAKGSIRAALTGSCQAGTFPTWRGQRTIQGCSNRCSD
jgi:ribosomal protein S27AE